ncbi:MAG: sigma-54-dependent Fis family transcriptional regulator [Burkholderiales bacterium]
MLRKEGVQHAERVYTSVRWQDDTAGNRLENERVRLSWERSLDAYKLDPARTAKPRILTGASLRDHQEPLESFLRIARHGVRTLHEQVHDANYVVLLTDSDGVTIDYMGSPIHDRELKKAGLYLGSVWTELEEGTCGVGTAIIDKTPITVHKREHFRAPNTTLTCSAAPIFNVDGTMLGILDASALYSPDDRRSQNLVFRFVTHAADLIENAHFLDHFNRAWVLQLSRTQEFLQVQTDDLVAFDESGKILALNRRAQVELTTRATAMPHSIEDLFQVRIEALIRTGASSQIVMPLRTTQGNRQFFARVRAPDAKRRDAMAEKPLQPVVATQSTKPGDAMRRVTLAGFAVTDQKMSAAIVQGKRLADTHAALLIVGEEGTEKDAFARAIHYSGARRDQPFIQVNCAEIPPALLADEVFGTANRDRPRTWEAQSKLQQASHGTLFLANIDKATAQFQRILREFVGSVADPHQSAKVRIICALDQALSDTNRSHLPTSLINLFGDNIVSLPALRERSDLDIVIDQVLHDEAQLAQKPLQLGETARQSLASYSWSRNMQEIRGLMKYLCATRPSGVIEMQDLPAGFALNKRPEPGPTPEKCLSTPVAETSTERQIIVAALRKHHWQVLATARALGMARATIYRKMAKYQIVSPNKLEN